MTTRVLFIDRAWPVIGEAVRRFADSVRDTDMQVLFLTDKAPSSVQGNFETININDVPQRKSLEELQAAYPFSLHKTLVPERAFFDYSSFRQSQCYSRLSGEQIAALVTPFANAFDYVIRERADVIIDWYPDCFIPAMAGQIARHYGKPFRMVFAYYWWNDGALFIDKPDLTSSDVETNYRHFYANPSLCDRAALDERFRSKKCSFVFTSGEMYTFAMRLRQAWNRFKSYEPPSLRYWIVRKLSKAWSAAAIRALIKRHTVAGDKPFVLFPLHVSPEASLLGTYPELAEQFALIKNLSLNLPYGVELYVKEHPGQEFGLGLDYDFYRRLAALPNVRIFHARANLDKLLDHPQFLAAAVINGTVGLDAARKRKPVFLYGRALYGVGDCFLKPADFEEFQRLLRTIQQGKFVFDEDALYAVLQALDASIVRADVDFLASRTAREVVLMYPTMWRRYIESGAWKPGAATARDSAPVPLRDRASSHA